MTALVAVLAVAVAGWFGAGTIWNVRKGTAFMRWMQGGLPLLGERTTMRWLGSTAVELGIREAKAPFQQVTLVIFLEPRDVPWWPVSRGLGRRDTLIIRAQLRHPPRDDLEVLAPESWSGRDALRGIAAPEWSLREGPLSTWTRSEDALPRADALLEIARGAGMSVRRLSVRRAEPHLQLHIALPSTDASAGELFQAVRALGERATA